MDLFENDALMHIPRGRLSGLAYAKVEHPFHLRRSRYACVALSVMCLKQSRRSAPARLNLVKTPDRDVKPHFDAE